jgi:hypothetical protein
MKDKFEHLETEMTLEEKFKLVCKAIGIKPEDVKGPDIKQRYAHQRAFVVNFLFEYLRFGLPELINRAPVTIYTMNNKVKLRRMKKEPNVLRMDTLLAKHVDSWLKK